MHIRLSPSGPIVGEAGAGFRLRMSESKLAVTGGVQTIPTVAAIVAAVLGTAPALEVGFASGVQPGLAYRSTIVMDIENTSNQEATIQLDIQSDFTGGGFATVATSTHLIEPATSRQIRCDLPIGGVTSAAGATQAKFRAMISGSRALQLLNSPSTGATIDFQVEEMLSA
jgi:hypothetical protein